MWKKITTDMIVGSGLVVALIIGVCKGAPNEFLSCLATGLVGFIGKVTVSSNPSENVQEAVQAALQQGLKETIAAQVEAIFKRKSEPDRG